MEEWGRRWRKGQSGGRGRKEERGRRKNSENVRLCEGWQLPLHPHTHTLTFVLPVKESRLILLSLAIASPISAPPQTVVQMAGGRSFADNTF